MFFGLLLIVLMFVLVLVDKMSVEQWQGSVEIIFGVLVGGKTATTIAGIIKGPAPAPVAPEQGGAS